MPTIEPPNDNTLEEEEPKKKLPPYVPPFGLTPWEDNRRVELFLNVPSWICVCGLTNFGRNLRCAKQTCNKERPNDWRLYSR